MSGPRPLRVRLLRSLPAVAGAALLSMSGAASAASYTLDFTGSWVLPDGSGDNAQPEVFYRSVDSGAGATSAPPALWHSGGRTMAILTARPGARRIRATARSGSRPRPPARPSPCKTSTRAAGSQTKPPNGSSPTWPGGWSAAAVGSRRTRAGVCSSCRAPARSAASFSSGAQTPGTGGKLPQLGVRGGGAAAGDRTSAAARGLGAGRTAPGGLEAFLFG